MYATIEDVGVDKHIVLLQKGRVLMKAMRGMVILCCLVFVCIFGAETAMAAQPPVEIEEITYEDLTASLVYGSRVVIRKDTRYYASADMAGSGPSGTIGNQYTPMGCDIYVGGFATLGKDNWLKTYRGYEPKDVPVSKHWKSKASSVFWDQTWVEIFVDSDESVMGWVPARSIVALNGILGDGNSNKKFRHGIKIVPKKEDSDSADPEEKLPAEMIDRLLPDPGNAIEDRIINKKDDGEDSDDFISTREIAYSIEDYEEAGETVALLMDASGSVSDYILDIADYGEYANKANKAKMIAVFATTFQKIRVEDYLHTEVDGSSTNIYKPLNELTDIVTYDRIIIVTDTWHNTWETLKPKEGFAGKIVIVCPEPRAAHPDVIKEIEEAFGTKVYLCRLDNEIDRMKALQQPLAP